MRVSTESCSIRVSGFREILACRIRDPANFCCGIWNPRLWNSTEYTSQGIRNPTNDWNPESKFHWLKIRNPIPGIRNPLRGIRNPRLSGIPLHVTISQLLLKLHHDSTISLALVNTPYWVLNDQNRFSKRKDCCFLLFIYWDDIKAEVIPIFPSPPSGAQLFEGRLSLTLG